MDIQAAKKVLEILDFDDSHCLGGDGRGLSVDEVLDARYQVREFLEEAIYELEVIEREKVFGNLPSNFKKLASDFLTFNQAWDTEFACSWGLGSFSIFWVKDGTSVQFEYNGYNKNWTVVIKMAKMTSTHSVDLSNTDIPIPGLAKFLDRFVK